MTKTKGAITAAAALGLAIIVLVRAAATASSAEIGDMAWDESNIATLRSANVADIEKFVNQVLCDDIKDCAPVKVREFAWADIEGDGKYALIDVWNTGGRAEGVGIYQRNSSAKVQENDGELTPAIPGYTTQSIDVDGYANEDLTNAIRDLNGDGKKELIVSSGFGLGRSMAETPLAQWPEVYRWQDGHYIEASREFPGFYDKEVLSPLEEKISTLQKKLDTEAEAKASGEAVMKEYHWYEPDIEHHTSPEQAHAVRDSEHLAVLQSLRNHILLALGRWLTAEEEKEPREWLKSSNETLVWYAEDAFEDMGGHESEVREAKHTKSGMIDDFRKTFEEKRRTPAAPVPPAN
jgi:hypothetical protein